MASAAVVENPLAELASALKVQPFKDEIVFQGSESARHPISTAEVSPLPRC